MKVKNVQTTEQDNINSKWWEIVLEKTIKKLNNIKILNISRKIQPVYFITFSRK